MGQHHLLNLHNPVKIEINMGPPKIFVLLLPLKHNRSRYHFRPQKCPQHLDTHNNGHFCCELDLALKNWPLFMTLHRSMKLFVL